MKKWFKRIFLLLVILFGVLILLVYWQVKDRHPGYQVDLNIPAAEVQTLSVGFSKVPITPKVTDTWEDSNEDAQYHPDDGDVYVDNNENGRFDPVWIAGFQNRRPAQGVHDELWARAMVIDDGATKIALVALDVIGFGADDIIDVRKSIAANLLVDYAIVTSTHTHEGPDMLGLWGASEFKSGIDPEYMHFVKDRCVNAITLAAQSTRPAYLRFAQDFQAARDLVVDSRKPHVLDPAIRLMQVIDQATGKTIGSLYSWANHPETLWNDNLLLTSDFPHYIREGMEKGVFYNDSLAVEGIGGICIYVNGAIGGLMTTLPEFGIEHPFEDTIFTVPSFDKAKAQGDHLALLGLSLLRDSTKITGVQKASIALSAKTFEIPLQNKLYRLAAVLGVLDRGMSGFLKIRTEVAAWKLGPATFLHQPGEIYPEIINGGIEKPEGQDFNLPPQETPAIRELMPGDFRFVVGLSNDMIGYILPKSQWDAAFPYTYGVEHAPYGEINSVGSETGPLVYEAMKTVLENMNVAHQQTQEKK